MLTERVLDGRPAAAPAPTASDRPRGRCTPATGGAWRHAQTPVPPHTDRSPTSGGELTALRVGTRDREPLLGSLNVRHTTDDSRFLHPLGQKVASR